LRRYYITEVQSFTQWKLVFEKSREEGLDMLISFWFAL